MIGLIAIGALGFWLVITLFLTYKIPKWLGIANYKKRTVIELCLFPLILVAPVVDDLIGMWQFRQLCGQMAVNTLNSGWESVTMAKRIDLPRREIENSIIPIHIHVVQFKDIETGRIFLTTQMLTTKGGLLRRYSYGLDNSKHCSPKDLNLYKKVNLDELIQNGESNRVR